MRISAVMVILTCLLSVCSCGGGSKMDARFQQIDTLCDTLPTEAIRLLDSIDRTGLSEKDLNRWRLLWIKSRDKAYIAHMSDTLILDVVDYYAGHRREGLYPEALYYGGRVYSDLGDLPTALEFFQKSLDEIPEDEAHLPFKSTVLNQTGRLLHALRLDSAAIVCLEKSLDIEKRSEDNNYRLAYTHSFISDSYLGLKNVTEACIHLNEALRLSSEISSKDRLAIKSKLAEVLLWKGDIASALKVVRPLPIEVDSMDLSVCLAIATQIYKEAGILDTACMYAQELTRLNELNGKKTGYTVLFSDKLRDHVDKDTLLKLMPEYKQVVEKYLNTHEAEQSLIQNARYNYSIHLKKREESERRLRSLQKRLWISASTLAFFLLILLSVILWRKYGRAKKDTSLMIGYILTEKVKETVRKSREENDEDMLAKDIANPTQAKIRILKELEIVKENNPLGLISEKLKESPIYQELKHKAENKEHIGKNITWIQIEDLVKGVSPDFELYLSILTDNKITNTERKVALLMKLGFSNTQIADLLDRQPGTISRQRTSIAGKIGCEKSTVDSMVMRL